VVVVDGVAIVGGVAVVDGVVIVDVVELLLCGGEGKKKWEGSHSFMGSREIFAGFADCAIAEPKNLHRGIELLGRQNGCEAFYFAAF
jgi:hypothetical protein